MKIINVVYSQTELELHFEKRFAIYILILKN